MFCDSKFKGDISKWNLSNLSYAVSMFENSKIRSNVLINLAGIIDKENMFKNSKLVEYAMQ
jgi:hypothetical protein